MSKKYTEEKIDVKLKYSGEDVNDGSMSVEDFVEAVQGFSGVYGKLSISKGASQKHNIRITGVEKGSVDILLTVKQLVEDAGKNSDGIQTLLLAGGALGGTGIGIIKMIAWFIKIIKHTKKKPASTQIKDSFIVIQNSDNVILEVPITIFNVYKQNENAIKNDLYKIAKPLEEGKIESAEILASYNSETIDESIKFEEKEFFDPKEEDLTQTDKVWIQGVFNSLTKSTYKGYFILTDHSRVVYEFKNERPEDLFVHFLHKGVVRVLATIHLDQNLKPTKLDIYDVQDLQLQMDFKIWG